MLLELAAELRAARDEHRRDITQLRTDLAGLSTLLGENADLLGQVMIRLRDLEGELGELADRVDTSSSAPSPHQPTMATTAGTIAAVGSPIGRPR